MSTITREFTKEQLQQIEAAAKEVLWPVVWSEKKAREHFSEKITPKVVLKLARIALASLEAEPVYQVYGNSDDTWSDVDEEEMIRLRRDGEDTRTLYTAPSAPVSVPDERSAFNAWNNDTDCPLAGLDLKKAAWLAWSRRAAMLQGAEPVKTACKLRDAVEIIRNSGIAIDAEKILAERDALNAQDCWCRTCRPVTFSDSRFVVCPDCGNKRCPHANDHRNACTGSNEPGQEGSAYPAAPQQEA